jgi:hypothetical protein
MAVVEEPVAIDGRPAPLHGTLALPGAAGGDLTAALIIAGSGPVDRDGNLPGLTNDSLKGLAHGLTARGIATLRVDKRGVAASRGAAAAEEDLRFGTYVADAVAWLGRLREHPRVRRLALVGHSEGALVATLAARLVPDVAALVLVAGAGAPAGLVLRRQFEAAGMPPDLRLAAERALASLEAGRPAPDAPAALAGLLRPSVQPYLMSWLGIDPARELARVAVPTLVVQGGTDIQVGDEDADRLASARPGIERARIDAMNHVLKRAPADRAANAATYGDPTLPVMPELVEHVADFLRRVVPSP